MARTCRWCANCLPAQCQPSTIARQLLIVNLTASTFNVQLLINNWLYSFPVMRLVLRNPRSVSPRGFAHQYYFLIISIQKRSGEIQSLITRPHYLCWTKNGFAMQVYHIKTPEYRKSLQWSTATQVQNADLGEESSDLPLDDIGRYVLRQSWALDWILIALKFALTHLANSVGSGLSTIQRYFLVIK